jgi:hypothetical protein
LDKAAKKRSGPGSPSADPKENVSIEVRLFDWPSPQTLYQQKFFVCSRSPGLGICWLSFTSKKTQISFAPWSGITQHFFADEEGGVTSAVEEHSYWKYRQRPRLSGGASDGRFHGRLGE